MNIFRKTVVSLLSVMMVLVSVPFTNVAFAASVPTVTAATGGTAISYTTANGAYTSLTGPVITETASGQIVGNNGNSSPQLVLTVPTGFQFNTGSSVTATVSEASGCNGNGNSIKLGTKDGTGQTVTPTASTITIDVKASSKSNCKSIITFSGIQVRPTATSPLASGNIMGSGSALPSDFPSSTNFGTLTEVGGTPSQIVIGASQTTKEAPGSVTLTLTVKDSNNVAVADGTSVNLSTNFGTLSGTGTTVNGVLTRTLTSNTVGVATLTSDLTLSGDTTITFVDTTKPVITITGQNPVQVSLNGSYTDAGATALDAVDGDLTSSIQTTGTVDTATLGSYQITYSVTDSHENSQSAIRTVQVVDQEIPVITLNGQSELTIEAGTSYTDAGATATDNIDGDLTGSIVTGGTVNTAVLGTYYITYDVQDSAHNSATQVTRTVHVVDTTAPVITLSGSSPVTVTVGSVYFDAGATATDSFQGNLTPSIVTVSTVNTSVVGTYSVTYNVSDSSGNAATEVTRTVYVRPIGTDSSLSALSTDGFSLTPAFASTTLAYAVTLPYGSTTAPAIHATTTDSRATYTITPAVDVTSTSTADRTATVKVTAEDGTTISNYTIVFTVALPDTAAPVITLNGTATQTIELNSVFSDQGATATDNIDGDITSKIVTTGSVNTSVEGFYTLTYNVSDAAGNAATPVTRTVIVVKSSNSGGGSTGGGTGYIPTTTSTTNSTTTPPFVPPVIPVAAVPENANVPNDNGNGTGTGTLADATTTSDTSTTTATLASSTINGSTTASNLNQTANALAATGASGFSTFAWWILIVILLILLAYFTYRQFRRKE